MAERSGNQTYYELLEIPQSAGPMDIYNAYQRARKTYSPSSPALYSMFSPEEASQLMSLIEEAYQTLSHQGRRKEYDQKIGLGATPTPPKPASRTNHQEKTRRTMRGWDKFVLYPSGMNCRRGSRELDTVFTK